MPQTENKRKKKKFRPLDEKEKLVKEVAKIIERTEVENRAIEKIFFKTNKGLKNKC